MELSILEALTAEFSEKSETNYLSPPVTDEEGLQKLESKFHANNFNKHNMPQGGDFTSLNKGKTEEYVGMRFFMPPIFSVGRADDPGFLKIREPGVVGPHHKLPTDWLPTAKSVITLFLPFSERVIRSNTVDPVQPSYEWLFTRVDGQQHLLATAAIVQEALKKEGYQAIVPQTDDRYYMRVSPMEKDIPIPTWSSNWSERHVAYLTGMGTFGRMTNFISKKGCCGRLISVVTDWECTPTEKDYEGLYDYCADCGACYGACPGKALSEKGKEIAKCSEFLRVNCVQYAPRYGCGKCQSGLPCSTGPARKR